MQNKLISSIPQNMKPPSIVLKTMENEKVTCRKDTEVLKYLNIMYFLFLFLWLYTQFNNKPSMVQFKDTKFCFARVHH